MIDSFVVLPLIPSIQLTTKELDAQVVIVEKEKKHKKKKRKKGESKCKGGMLEVNGFSCVPMYLKLSVCLSF